MARCVRPSSAEAPEAEPPWVYFHDHARVLFQRGIVEGELGRHGQAAELFAAACAALPENYPRGRSRYLANLALAADRDGDVDRAVVAGRKALDLVRDTGSAHALADLRAMRAALEPHAATPAVREFDGAARPLR